MRCPGCGTENRADRKFCAGCGSALAITCPACGAGNLPGDRFCGECGTSLASAGGATPEFGSAVASLAAAMPAIAERRLVTVLFADLVGFTNLSESLDMETIRELQSTYFDGARAIVERYGGAVEKFIGDAVMAVWGAPVAHEDDAERAVRAALDIVDAVTVLGDGMHDAAAHGAGGRRDRGSRRDRRRCRPGHGDAATS